MRFTAILLSLGSVLACGCSGSDLQSRSEREKISPAESANTDSTSERIRTDSAAYSLRSDGPGWTTTIGFRYWNTGADTVYVVNCNGAILMNLQKREAGEWKDAWNAEGNQCLSPALIVPPGRELRGEVGIWGAEPGNPSYNTFKSAEVDGEYRLVWYQPVHHYDPRPGSFGDTIPLADRVSNAFTLKKASSDQ